MSQVVLYTDQELSTLHGFCQPTRIITYFASMSRVGNSNR